MSDMSTSSIPSGVTGAGGGNTLRITGMASGLDVDAMVKKMMASEQVKIDKAKQTQQTVQWKQEAYQKIITDVKDLQSTYFDVTKPDSYVFSQNFFSSFNVTPADSTKLNATASVGAQAGTYSVSFDNGGQLAAAAKKVGALFNVSSGATTTNWDSKSLSFSLNGASDIEITLGDSSAHGSIDELITDINGKINANSSLSGKIKAAKTSDGKVQFNVLSSDTVKLTSSIGDVSNLTGKIINPSNSTTMAQLGMTDSTYSLKFKYNNTDYLVKINSTDKISDVITNISTATGGGVKASIDQLTNKFMLQSSGMGSGQSIQLTSGDFAPLGLTTDTTAVKGQDAIVTITPPGGTGVQVSRSSNNFSINNVNFNLVQAANSSFTVTQDAEKVYTKINDFITKYNSIVDEVQTKLQEKKDKAYPPLTDAQRSSMSSTDITAWETKAKVGILRNDDNLNNLMNSLRSAFTTPIKGSSLTFGKYGSNSIGLDTYDQSNTTAGTYIGGKIVIADKSKLIDAITNNSDQLRTFFTGTSDSTDTAEKFNNQGIFSRIGDILTNNVGRVGTSLNSAVLTKYANLQDDFSKNGGSGTNTLADQLYYQKNILTQLSAEYSTKQETYYQQFSKLETAMQQLSQQQSYLSQQFGS